MAERKANMAEPDKAEKPTGSPLIGGQTRPPNYKDRFACRISSLRPRPGNRGELPDSEFPASIVSDTASDEERQLDRVWKGLSVAESRKIMKMPRQQRLQYLRYLRNTTKIYPVYIKSQSKTVLADIAESWCLPSSEVQGIVARLDSGGMMPADIRANIGAFRELQAHRVLESHERTRSEIERQIDIINGSDLQWFDIQMEDGPKGKTTKRFPREKALLQLHKARDATFKAEADTLPMYIPEPVKETEVRISADIESMSQDALEVFIEKSQKRLEMPRAEATCGKEVT